MSRQLNRMVCRVFVAALLFAQFAVAAHACQMMLRGPGQAQPATANAVLTGGGTPALEAVDDTLNPTPCVHAAPALDAGSPNLCLEHCSYGEQSNQSSTLTVPAMAMISLYGVQPLRGDLPQIRAAAASTDSLLAASPPHSILHCCFLI